MSQVWFDATSMVDYNMEMLNRHDLEHSFFHLSRQDPTQGFAFNATRVAGHTFPKETASQRVDVEDVVSLRLTLGSHFALYLRHQLEEQKGYTSTVGIATNKLLSKLVGNLNKPKAQTTIMPPLGDSESGTGNAITFMDDHEIGKVPGIGFKLAQRLREFVLHRPAEYEFAYGGTKENVTVAAVRNHPEVNFEKLETLLGGPGSPHGIGYKVWCLLHGVDDSEVSQAKPVPSQISIEDSYIRLDTMPELLKELHKLARSLIKRMRIDLLGDDDDANFEDSKEDAEDAAETTDGSAITGKKWLAHPKTLRLTTRPRLPLRQDGTRERTMKRISHSCPLPNFIFGLNESVEALTEKLVDETLITMFRKLHSEKSGWNLSLVNVAVTNMAESAGESKTASGRDIGSMFKRQDDVLKDFRVYQTSPEPVLPTPDLLKEHQSTTSWEDSGSSMLEDEEEGEWVEDESTEQLMEYCDICASHIPSFAMVAHSRFHSPFNDTPPP